MIAERKCPTCNGSGTVRQVQNTILGQMQTTKTCPTCGGEGTIIEEKCTECKGRGKIRKAVKVTVDIPEGISDGQAVVLRGEGDPGINGGPRGDLYIVVTVRRHKIFTRQDLMDEIWGLESESDIRTVDVHIKELREKLKSKRNKWEIKTIWNVGYKFEVK